MVEARGQQALFVASFAIAVPCMALGGVVLTERVEGGASGIEFDLTGSDWIGFG